MVLIFQTLHISFVNGYGRDFLRFFLTELHARQTVRCTGQRKTYVRKILAAQGHREATIPTISSQRSICRLFVQLIEQSSADLSHRFSRASLRAFVCRFRAVSSFNFHWCEDDDTVTTFTVHSSVCLSKNRASFHDEFSPCHSPKYYVVRHEWNRLMNGPIGR